MGSCGHSPHIIGVTSGDGVITDDVIADESSQNDHLDSVAFFADDVYQPNILGI